MKANSQFLISTFVTGFGCFYGIWSSGGLFLPLRYRVARKVPIYPV